jgi:DNA repair exonuclease SbcCD nuclease subunit
MGKNSKPILSVLVDEDKKEKFADLARLNKYSMGWLLNDCIDRMLAADSIEVYGEPARNPQLSSISTLPIDTSDIENLVNTYIDKLDIEGIVNTSIGKLDIESMIKTSISTIKLDESLRGEVNAIGELVAELETYTQNQFKAVRDELKAISNRSVTAKAVANVPTSPRKEKPNADGDTRTWCGFFEMVGMTAMTATEAQKKENTDIRTQQIEQGLQSAIDKGLGEWAVKRAGRDFMRV